MQLLFAAIVPFEKESEPAPAVGAKTGAPQPFVVAFGVASMTIAAGEVGKVSVKFSPLTAPAFGLVRVNVSVETPPALVGFGENCFAMVTLVGSMIFAIREPVEKSAL